MSPAQRRRHYTGRRAIGLAMVVLLAGALVCCDRMGLLGARTQTDIEKYDGKTCVVTKAVDGDTVHIDIPDGDKPYTIIRLWGVDTPETKKPHTPVQHFGPEASAFTHSQCDGKTVRLELDSRELRDKYGRLLAYIYLPDGRMLNRTLVEEGYAYADPRFKHRYDREFQRLEDKARKANLGLWKDLTADDIPAYHPQKSKWPTK